MTDFSEMARTILEFSRYVVAARDLRHQRRDAMTTAKQAAGDKEVSVHGAAVARLAGVLDELELHVVPVLLGPGGQLFDGLDPEHIELERVRVLEGEHGVTHLRYRVRHGA